MAERKKILIIDDDEDFRISIRTLLESNNYKVTEAESGKQGLQRIKSDRPDLIVLDIMMETIDEGYLLNQVIKYQQEFEGFKNVPILMVSSIQEDPLSRFPTAAGQVDMIMPDYYFTKPVDIPKFLSRIGELLNPSA